MSMMGRSPSATPENPTPPASPTPPSPTAAPAPPIAYVPHGQDLAGIAVALSANGKTLAVLMEGNSVRQYLFDPFLGDWSAWIGVTPDRPLESMRMTADARLFALGLSSNSLDVYPVLAIYTVETGVQLGSDIGGLAAVGSNIHYRVRHAQISDNGRVVVIPTGSSTAVFSFDDATADWVMRDATLGGYVESSDDSGDFLDLVGNLVSVSSDGSKVVTYDIVGTSIQVWSYEWNGSSYVERTEAITFSDGAFFSGAVFLSGDGDSLAVNGWFIVGDGILGILRYITRIYRYQNEGWVQQGRDLLAAGDPLGTSEQSDRACFSSDGNAFGILADSTNGPYIIYSWNGNAWAMSEIVSSGEKIFGERCSFSQDGRILALFAQNGPADDPLRVRVHRAKEVN